MFDFYLDFYGNCKSYNGDKKKRERFFAFGIHVPVKMQIHMKLHCYYRYHILFLALTEHTVVKLLNEQYKCLTITA